MSRFLSLEEHVRAIAEDVVARALREFDPTPREWFDSKQAAEFLGVSRVVVHQLVHKGQLARNQEKGHKLLFSRTQLNAYLAGRTTCGPGE